MERTDKLNQLKQFNRPWEYDCCDIAEKLVELSNLPDDGQLKNELTDALYYLKAVAENPYNSDYHRVLPGRHNYGTYRPISCGVH